MQSVLNLMPESITEVPRDTSRQQSGGVHDNERAGEFGSVYEQELYENRGQDRNHDKESRSSQGGNDLQRIRQSEADHRRSVDVRDGKARLEDDQSIGADAKLKRNDSSSTVIGKPIMFDPSRVVAQGGKPGKFNAEQGGDAADTLAMNKTDKSVDQLLSVVEKAETLIRQNNGTAIRAGDSGRALTQHIARQNTLSAAIDSALAEKGGAKVTLNDIINGFSNAMEGDEAAKASGVNQGITQGEGKGDKAGQFNQAGLAFKQGVRTPTDGVIHTPGINPKIDQDGEQAAADANAKSELFAGKLKSGGVFISDKPVGKDPLGDIEKNLGKPILPDQRFAKGDGSVGEDKLQTLIAKEAAKNTSEGIQTPGINPKNLRVGDKPATQVPDILAHQQAKGLKPGPQSQQKPVEIGESGQGKPSIDLAIAQGSGNRDSGPLQTGGIVSPDFEHLAKEQPITKPFEQAGKPQMTPLVNATESAQSGANQNETKPLTAQMAAADYQTKPKVDKTDKPFIGVTAKGDKKNTNILGTDKTFTSGAKLAADAPISAESGKMSQELQMSERKLMETIAAQNTQPDSTQTDDKLARMMPKDLSGAMSNKSFNPLSATNNAFSVDNNASLNPATATKAAEKATEQLSQALNTTKPDFSANMKERLVIMMNKGVQTANIRLDPAELGQMQIKMSIENDVTSVSIVVQNSQAKELLEQTLPKLKEMLAEQGIEMDEGSVEQESREQREQRELGDGQHRGGQHAAQGEHSDQEDIDMLAAQQVKITNGALGGIDFFA
ncbi:MAG: flagellar hook-length control protein FliK [Algicola sp.]|nr:flagellar hook-length control protein FliK [Algicola sp.]